MKIAVFLMGVLVGANVMLSFARADQRKIDLAASVSADQWAFPEKTASVRDGQLVLDGRKKMSRAFFTPITWDGDVTLRAKFMVEPQKSGVLACGFIIRAADASSYYYVHFDRAQAILVRSSLDKSWAEIKRVGNLKKPAGQWHDGELRCEGDTLSVSLNGQKLYEAKVPNLAGGRIGFYANQGRAHVKDVTVTGDAHPAASKFVIPKPQYVYVCEDAGAGGYEAFPDVCRLGDGRLLSCFYAGYGHVSLPNVQLPKGGRISFCTSDDDGRTWSQANVLYDGPDDDRDPSIVQLKSGRLICNFFSLRKKTGSRRGFVGLGTWIVTSDDLGKTWSAARPIAKDAYCSSPIRELSDGRLILGLYRASSKTAFGAMITSP